MSTKILLLGNASNSWRPKSERKPSTTSPALGDEGADDGVVLGGVFGVVTAPVLLRRRRRAAPSMTPPHGATALQCQYIQRSQSRASRGVSLGILVHRLRREWEEGGGDSAQPTVESASRKTLFVYAFTEGRGSGSDEGWGCGCGWRLASC
jgi:hypothetical protein